jgi:ectoine hydroxylase-related dioxygenase (phytanoyl-CoA dioxygenase family)
MHTPEEKSHFLEHGYLHAKAVLEPALLDEVRAGFDKIWDENNGKPCNQTVLLKHPLFIKLIEHPAILNRHRAMFGRQVQLLQYDFLRQGPKSTAAVRSWHRDFAFPGDNPISTNTILYLDDMTDESGPTYVVPGTQRGPNGPPKDKRGDSLPGEVAAYAKAGDAVFINSAIWHSGSRNNGNGLRRAIYLYYGYWWLKRYDAHQTMPWQPLENASEQRLRLLGVKMPDNDLHMYDPSRAE